jgi:hypothetical protein
MSAFPEIRKARQDFHRELCKQILWIDPQNVATNADKDSEPSRAIARALAMRLGARRNGPRLSGQTAGMLFEKISADFINASFRKLSHLRPGKWTASAMSEKGKTSAMEISDFEQYSHLREIQELTEKYPQLRTALGSDYFIKPDIVIAREPEEDREINRKSSIIDDSVARLTPLRKKNNPLPILHASISCKWTIRSDRSQNSRSEALNLVRNRKGNTPHIAVLTAEPTPNRISSIALGTGDIDCVYHVALHELTEAIAGLTGYDDSRETLQMLVEGKRLRDISDLPLDLAI